MYFSRSQSPNAVSRLLRLDRYFVFSDQTPYELPRDYSRTNGLLEEIRQSFLGVSERQRLEEDTRPRQLRVHDAQQPIELPLVPAPGGATHRWPSARARSCPDGTARAPGWRCAGSTPRDAGGTGHKRQPPHPRRSYSSAASAPGSSTTVAPARAGACGSRGSGACSPARRSPRCRAPWGGPDCRPVGPSLLCWARSKRAPWRGKLCRPRG